MTNTHIDKEARLMASVRVDDLPHLRKYVEASGSHHCDTCPGDDTCNCCWKATLEAVERICKADKPPLPAEGEREDGKVCGCCFDSRTHRGNPCPGCTSQPAEPKVMPSDHAEYDRFQPCGCVPDLRYCDRHQPHLGGYAEGDYRTEWRKKPHPPQPSEQANGAEWLPVTMRTASAFSFALAGLGDARRLAEVQDRDTQWRSFIESERSQHKAEMEAVKKGASR